MKEKIEMMQRFNNKGEEIIALYLHSSEYGLLWLEDIPFSKGVKEYFMNGKSMNELHKYKYGCNKTLNKIIDRLPAYIKYAKQETVMCVENQKSIIICEGLVKDIAA